MNRTSNRLLMISAVAVVVLVAIPAAGPAATPAVGSATTSISLLSVAGYLGGVGQSVEIGAGSGLATTDPARQSLSSKTAAVEFAAARASGAQAIESSSYDFSARADESKSSDSGQNFEITLTGSETPATDLVIADVDIGAYETTVYDLFARAALTEVKVDAGALSGLVSLDDAVVGIAGESSTDKAVATQGVSFGKLSIFSLSDLLGQLGRSVADLAAFSDLADLGDQLGLPAGATQPLRDAQADYDAAGADEAAWAAAVAELLDGDLDLAADTAALQAIAGFAAKYATFLTGDPTDPAVVAATMALVKAPLLAILDAARSTLAATVGDLALVTLEGVTAGVSAEASDQAASASAGVSWTSAKVAELTVPTLDDINATLADLTGKVSDIVNAVGDAVGLSLSVSLKIGEEIESTSVDGSYQVAVAELTAVSVDVTASLPIGGSFGSGVLARYSGIQAQAGGSNLTAGTKVLSLRARSEHKPATSDAPPGSPGAGGPGLAATGYGVLWSLSGILALGLGLRLRRWLGDAA